MGTTTYEILTTIDCAIKSIYEDNFPENQMRIDGKYQNCLFNAGQIAGFLRTALPCLFCCCIKYPYIQIEQSHEGVYERYGKYIKTVKSGLQYMNPCTDEIFVIDVKTQRIDVNNQWCFTKDNILVKIDATAYYKVKCSKQALYTLQNVDNAVGQLTFATLRSVIGRYKLQDVLEKRQTISQQIENFVEEHTAEWGIHIENMVIKDIQLSQDLQTTLSSAAKEQRISESKIISAMADVKSAQLMRESADILSSKGAMQIRYLDTIQRIGQKSKIIFYGEDDDTTQQQSINDSKIEEKIEKFPMEK